MKASLLVECQRQWYTAELVLSYVAGNKTLNYYLQLTVLTEAHS